MDLTQGSAARRLVRFTLPIIVMNIFGQLYSLVDSVIVAQFAGNRSLAARGGQRLHGDRLLSCAGRGGAHKALSSRPGQRRLRACPLVSFASHPELFPAIRKIQPRSRIQGAFENPARDRFGHALARGARGARMCARPFLRYHRACVGNEHRQRRGAFHRRERITRRARNNIVHCPYKARCRRVHNAACRHDSDVRLTLDPYAAYPHICIPLSVYFRDSMLSL